MKCERQTQGTKLPRLCPHCGHGSILEHITAPRIVPGRLVRPDLVIPASLHPEARPDLDTDTRMAALVASFPVLGNRDCVGGDPWDPTVFASNWDLGWVGGTATRQAVSFVLSVWCGPSMRDRDPFGNGAYFCAVEALQTWDPGQRGAFVAWAQRPWWA